MLVVTESILDEAFEIDRLVTEAQRELDKAKIEQTQHLAKANELVREATRVWNQIVDGVPDDDARELLIKGDDMTKQAAGHREDALVCNKIVRELEDTLDRLLGNLVWVPDEVLINA